MASGQPRNRLARAGDAVILAVILMASYSRRCMKVLGRWLRILFGISLIESASAQTLLTGLVGYWNFDEGAGSMLGDSSGVGNNGALINGAAPG